ncbi:MAG: Na/Pi cotransporter family protein [Clostridia bacterium]|nr:Na/Pi cotransporter family protein [Clostridia bacterium]
MDLFDVLSMIGGLSLFLFGMNVMGQALERRAGNSLLFLLKKLTTNRLAGLVTGLAITAVIQSSSATTVMVVGFVNSGLMSLTQAINVIMGANVGTTVTSWILSLSGIESSNIFVRLLKPTSFTPILALAGVAYYMFSKNSKKKDTGLILLGFATLMFGMDAMSGAVKGLSEVEGFRNLFVMFENPVLGVLAGTVLTAVIQSSSASVGILQAFAQTGQITFGAAVPIIMGQNIGTCVTAMISSIGANKNARRAAFVHLLFNVLGTIICLIIYLLIDLIFSPAILGESASLLGIAVCHSAFNIACTVILLPQAGFLEKFVCRLVPDGKKPDNFSHLDERLLGAPGVALKRCHLVAGDMADLAKEAIDASLALTSSYQEAPVARIRELEDQTDRYEDELGTYLVKLSAQRIGENDSTEAAGLLKMIGDLERIADHSVNLVESAEELKVKDIHFTKEAEAELNVIVSAVREVVDLAITAFKTNDPALAERVEPLEQVIDHLKEALRTRHIMRLQRGVCTIEAGFVWSDLLTALERTSDHCSNIAGCIIDMAKSNLNLHESLRHARDEDSGYRKLFQEYALAYQLPDEK